MDTIIEILIDNSNSMGPLEVEKNNGKYLLPDGSTRMKLAKSILIDEILPNFDYASKITIRKFHSNVNEGVHTPVIYPIYEGGFDLETISKKILEIPDPINTGGTPITAAIKESIENLSKSPGANRQIFLITDGEENGTGNFRQDVEPLLKQHGILFVIGIAQNEEASIKSEELVKSTGGGYINLQSKVYNKEAIQEKLKPISIAAINHTLQNIASLNSPDINQEIPTPAITEASETKESKTEHQVEFPKFEEIIKNNTSSIGVLAKQLIYLSDEVKSFKKLHSKEESDDDVLIDENAELNERVGLASESHLFQILKKKFGERVKWLNQEKESGSSYDFEVIDDIDNSVEVFIECKGSMFPEKVFFLTKGEWELFLKNSKNYQLYFLSNALNNPQVTKIDNLMDWLIRGKVVPYLNKNIKLKKERIAFTILD